MKKLCIVDSTCTKANYCKILNSCKDKYEIVRNYLDADYIIFPFCNNSDSMIEIMKGNLKAIVKSKKPDAKIIVTGCITYSKDEKKAFLNDYPIDYIVPMNNQVEDICNILDVKNTDNPYDEYGIIGKVIIGDGCLNKCSFCRIHYSNRPLKSRPIEEIVAEVKKLVSNGVKIINLVAFNTAQYGIDLYEKQMLHEVLKEISKIEGIENINVESVSLSDMYDNLMEELKSNDLVTGVSIDIQSGSDRILKLMNVGHSVSDIKRVYEELSDKMSFTRIISGFPTETIDDVQETISLLDSLDIKNIDVCDYRNSEGVPSSKLPQLSDEEKKVHFEMYNEEVEKKEKEFYIKNNNKLFAGRIYAFADGVIKIYIPNKVEYESIPIKQNHFDINLNDVIQVRLVNGEFEYVKTIQKSDRKTYSPNYSNRQLIEYLTNLNRITSQFALTSYKLREIFSDIYAWYDNVSNTKEEFYDAIESEPDAFKNALKLFYDQNHDEKN